MNNQAPYSNTTRLEHQGSYVINSTRIKIAKVLKKIFGNDFSWPTLLFFAVAPNTWIATWNTALTKNLYQFSGLLIILFGFLVRYWARSYEKKTSFVLDGPYRYLRNPVEFGSVLFYLGTGLLLNYHFLFILAVVSLSVFYLEFVSVIYETEVFMALGTVYLRYKSRVSRWFPSRLPGINKTRENLKLLRGLRQEKSSYFYFAGIFIIVALRNHLQLGSLGDKFLELFYGKS